MEDLVAKATRHVRVWAVKIPRGEADGFLKRVSEMGKSSGIEVLVLEGDLVFGADHIRSAFYHARKATDEGRNSSENISMETLLYASGERQLSSAIKKMSVDEETEQVAVVQVTPGSLKPDDSWTVMPDVLQNIEIQRLERFGIGEDVLDTIADDKAFELVLEKVASVDIMKK